MPRKAKWLRAITSGLLLLVLAACGSSAPAAAPTAHVAPAGDVAAAPTGDAALPEFAQALQGDWAYLGGCTSIRWGFAGDQYTTHFIVLPPATPEAAQ